MKPKLMSVPYVDSGGIEQIYFVPTKKFKKRQTKQTFDVATVRLKRVMWWAVDSDGQWWMTQNPREAEEWKKDEGLLVTQLFKVLEDA